MEVMIKTTGITTQKDAINVLREYNQTIDLSLCSEYEKKLIKHVNTKNTLYFWEIQLEKFPTSAEKFLKQNYNFVNLLKEHHEKLCYYLRRIQDFTCNRQLIRMDARSKNFEYYENRTCAAIKAFYLFYALKFDFKELVYGQYRQVPLYTEFAPVIATEIMQGNQEVIQYCKDVLLSENNTAVITRDVIIAIEQADNEELHKLLLDLFLAAKLQEGLRQSVIETMDENQVSLFISGLEKIQNHNLIRFSSVQRGVLTWIGIGNDIVEEKQVKMMFEYIYEFLHSKEALQKGLVDENPLKVYLALYCIGIYDIDEAIEVALSLLENHPRHIVASALIYLKMTRRFSVIKYKNIVDKFSDDVWICALYFDECCNKQYLKMELSPEEVQNLFMSIYCYAKRMKAQEKYVTKGFEWFHLIVQKDRLVVTMYELLQCHSNTEMVNTFLPFVSNLFYRGIEEFMEKYFDLASMKHKKEFLVKEIISGVEVLSNTVTKEFLKLSLTEEEMIELEGRLKTKKSYARANIMKVLANQKQELILKCYERLIASKTKAIHESALELKQLVPQYFEDLGNDIQKVEIKGKEEGYSLYVPKQYQAIPYSSCLNTEKKGFLFKKGTVDISFLQVWNKQQVLEYLELWSQRIKKHALDEYEVNGEIRQICQGYLSSINYGDHTLGGLPLGDVWREYFRQDKISEDVVFQLVFLKQSIGIKYDAIMLDDIKIFTLQERDITEIEYFSHYQRILNGYFNEVNSTSFPKKAMQYLELMNHYSKHNQYSCKDYWGKEIIYSIANLKEFQFMINQLKMADATDEEFKERFPVLYESYYRFNLTCEETTLSKMQIPKLILARAVHLELIPVEVLYEALLDTHTAYKNLHYYSYYNGRNNNTLFEGYREAYFRNRSIYGKPNFSIEEIFNKETEKDAVICLRNALDKIVDTLLPMEATRFNEETVVTDCVQGFRVIRGMKYLIMALRVLEGEELKRQNYGRDRNSIFTDVIRNCYPVEGDSPEMLQKEDISEKRLVEIAMLAPQWIDIINDVIKWDGFKEACYYFIAHMKEYDFQKKKAEIVQYTDIDPSDLNDGAFDIKWCKNIYQVLGEKRFLMIYQSAKFLCDNSFHTRARKYADACLEKQDKEIFLQQAKEKRNKDALNAYCICPIENDKDLLERYLYIQQFLKETKAFGAQRQASEKRTCEIALMNLARNSRFETVTRLSWVMETEVVQQYQAFLQPQKVEGIEVWIEIDSFGKNEIRVRKNQKMIKSIPAKLKKNEQILEMKNVHTLFNNQYKRSKQMLQTAMEERTVLGKEEIDAIARNPIVAPILKVLVLKNGEHFGFYKDGMLHGLEEIYELVGDIYIAHPYDLYKASVWKDYQRYVFEKQVVQPFKQVFRELYLKLEDELLQTSTKRYSGYQIQPQKAAGALKGRRWNASYESGLERVYHKEDLVVCLYADADWFSPSDIEAPSIDYVAFYHRKDNKSIQIQDIDDVIYSEIMRDVDLAVSTAFVGGVDPVTSLSTIELRRAIIEYTCELMKLENVTVQEHFANIEGAHNNYHIHLGSGMIHQDGGNSIYMIPIYSGKRGKVYLPFLDEDPMSAQILTKVIMLAEDTKIKDPAILNQIVTKKGQQEESPFDEMAFSR